MKKVVRLNENELKHMIMESVKRVLKESVSSDFEYEFYSRLYNIAEETCYNIAKRYAEKYRNFKGALDIFGECKISDIAQEYTEYWTPEVMGRLHTNKWEYPEKGIHNVEELLEQENPVEILVEWFLSNYHSLGTVKHKFTKWLINSVNGEDS